MSAKGKEKDGKEETLREAVKRRVGKEEHAFRIVEEMVLKESIDREFFVNAGMFITFSQYKDVIEERGITKLCGYPLCNNKLTQVLKQKYKISLKEKKVYDVTERKNFCSNVCYKASKYYESQLLADPVWLRDNKPSLQLKLLGESKDAKHRLSGSGEEIDISTNTDMHPSGDEVQETSKLCSENTKDEMVDVRSLGTDKDKDNETDNVNDILAGRNFCMDDDDDDDDDNDGINRLDDRMERDITYAIRHSDHINVDSDDDECDDDDDVDDDDVDDDDDDDYSDKHGNNDDRDCVGHVKNETSSKRQNLPSHQNTSNLLTQPTEKPATLFPTDRRKNTNKGIPEKHEFKTKVSQTAVSSNLNQTTKLHSLNVSGISIPESKVSFVSKTRNYADDRHLKDLKADNRSPQDTDQKTVALIKEESGSNIATENDCIGASSRSVDLENRSEDKEQELKRNHRIEVVCETLREWCSDETRSYCMTSFYSQDNTEEAGADTPKFLEEREIVSDGKSQVSKQHKLTTGERFLTNKKMSLPAFACKSQITIRGKIVSEKLTKALLPMLSRLGLSFADVSSHVTNILKTLKFTNTNIILRPSEWTLVALTILLTITRYNSTVKGLLFSSQKNLHLLLDEVTIREDDLDRLVTIFIPKDFALNEPASISDQREFNMEELD